MRFLVVIFILVLTRVQRTRIKLRHEKILYTTSKITSKILRSLMQQFDLISLQASNFVTKDSVF